MNHHEHFSSPSVCGEVELLELLIEAGANPSTPDIHGAYPLHYAAQVSCLLHQALGVTSCTDVISCHSFTPTRKHPLFWHVIIKIHHISARERHNGGRSLQMCGPNSEMGNDIRVGLMVLRKLLQSGVDVSVTDQDGRQPLLWAASAGEKRCSWLVGVGVAALGLDHFWFVNRMWLGFRLKTGDKVRAGSRITCLSYVGN